MITMSEKTEGKGHSTKWEVVMDFLRESALVKEERAKPILTNKGTEVLQELEKSVRGATSKNSRVSNSSGGPTMSREATQS
jgi:hypothetical protein